MPNPEEERMRLIQQSVMEQATGQHDEIVRQVQLSKETELKQYEDELVERMYRRIQNAVGKIRLETAQRRAQAEQASRRELLEQREQLAKSVFAAVRAQLAEYAATQDYRDALLDEIGALAGSCDHADSVVGLREADLGLAGEIRVRLGADCIVQADPSIEIGGFTLENRAVSRFVDGTLDARLRAQQPWFYENSGLRVR